VGRQLIASDRLIERWLQSVAMPNSQSAYRHDIAAFATWLVPTKRTVASTVNRRLSSLSALYRYAAEVGLRADNPAAAVDRLPAAASNASALTVREAEALWTAATEMGHRVSSLIALLLFDGIKLDEVLRSDADDVAGTGPNRTLAVTRRGRPMQIHLDPRSAVALAEYLTDRTAGPLLLAEGRASLGRLTRFGAHFIIREVGRHADLAMPATANQIRSSHVTLAHTDGDRIEAIQQRLGQVDRRTTARLVRPAREPGS
jgi:site-specific recombinase XerD